jgi:hypothetical protein
MTIAGSIILIMVGAVLTWAVDFAVAGVDIQVIGVILMLGGLAGLLFGIWRLSTVRRTAAVRTVPTDEVIRHRVYDERRDTDTL